MNLVILLSDAISEDFIPIFYLKFHLFCFRSEDVHVLLIYSEPL